MQSEKQPSSPEQQKSNPENFQISESKNLHSVFSKMIKDENSNTASLGPFKFDLNKLQVSLQDEEVSNFPYDQKKLIDASKAVISINIPHKLYASLTSYIASSFKPTLNKGQISLENTQYTPITISISHIDFSNLTVLNLAKQNLTSIEALEWLDAPKLACLELYENQIQTLEPLIKAKFNDLRILTFYHNPITKIDQLYRIKTKKLSTFQFDNNNFRRAGHPAPELMMDTKSKQGTEDYRFLFKLQSQKIQKINASHSSRINLKKSEMFKKLDQPGTEIIFYSKEVLRRRRMD